MGSYPKYGIILLLIFLLPWKLIFFIILILGSLIAVSASSWIMAWIGLEINILALLALLMSDKSPRNSEAVLKYFLVQAFASALLISRAFTARRLFSFLSSLSLFYSLIILSLTLKLGAAPFHLWVPQVVEGLSWVNNSIILSWQKLAPLVLLFSCIEIKFIEIILIRSIILSSLLGGIGGLTSSSLRKIIAFSSINHVGWILTGLMIKIILSILYLVFYRALLIILIVCIMKLNVTSLSNTNFSPSNKIQFPFIIALLSFGGLPPFLGFMPKWIIISYSRAWSVTITVFLVLTRVLTLFFYCRIIFNSTFIKYQTIEKSVIKHKSLSSIIIVNIFGLATAPIFLSL